MEAQKRHEERVTEVTEAERRLIMLQTEAASHVAIMKDPTDRPDWAAELDELRQKVNELQIENTELRGSCKRQAVSISPVGRPGPRLKEDFVPGCDDDIFRWMQDRQADIQEATLAGNAHEVTRLCHMMGSAVPVCCLRWLQCSPVTRRVPTYGHRGVRIGEASHPGPFHSFRRCRDQCNQHAILVDSSCVEAIVDNLDPPPRRVRPSWTRAGVSQVPTTTVQCGLLWMEADAGDRTSATRGRRSTSE